MALDRPGWMRQVVNLISEVIGEVSMALDRPGWMRLPVSQVAIQ